MFACTIEQLTMEVCELFFKTGQYSLQKQKEMPHPFPKGPQTSPIILNQSRLHPWRKAMLHHACWSPANIVVFLPIAQVVPQLEKVWLHSPGLTCCCTQVMQTLLPKIKFF